MSKFDLWDLFYQTSNTLTVKTIIVILIMACLLSAIIGATYYLTSRRQSFNVRFNTQLVLLTLIAAVIMMLISSNIVISLGMVGALSIIRFRSAMKDSRDTAYIFWAVTAGLCAGCQSFKLGFISTLFISLILLGLARLPIFWHKYILVITGQKDKIDIYALAEALAKESIQHHLRTASQEGKAQEMIYELILKNPATPELLAALTKVPGVKTANIISQQNDTIA